MAPDSSLSASSSRDAERIEDVSAAPVPELEALGRILVQAREAQGLSQVDLAQRLHMGLEQLNALERGDQQRLPEPVFVIAQARRVADALGVDIAAAIEAVRASERFIAGRPDLKTDVFQAAATRQARPESRPQQPRGAEPAPRRGGQPLAWLLLLAGLGSGGVWLWNQHPFSRPLLPSLSGQQRPGALPASQPPQVVSGSDRASTAVPEPALPVTELVLKARQPSWLEVRSASGGAPLFRGRFIGERRFPLGTGLRLRAGRPDLLLVAQGNSPARPLGTISEIRWVSFAPDVEGAISPRSGSLKPQRVLAGQTPAQQS